MRIVCVKIMEHTIKLLGNTNFQTPIYLLKVKCGAGEVMTFPRSH